MLRRQRAIEIVPGSEPLRWRWYDVPQYLAPETSEALRFCAIEGDLDLLDRRHRSTIEASASSSPRARGIVVSNGTVTLNGNAAITSNRATTDGGGIVSQTGGAAVTLNDSATITGNTAPATGGGIFNLCGTLNGAVAGTGGNVVSNKPDDIVSVCA